VLFLIDPQNPTKQACTLFCFKCDKCYGVVYPLYGIDPIPI
jgi:hypothetical protein